MTLEDKWKEAVNDLKDFSKIMELIKKYPIKEPIQPPKSAQYNTEGPILYQQSSFWN